MLLILQVQAGTKTATQAAEELGVSRQTFHQWEKRGLHALLQAMEEQPPGRPSTTENPEMEALQEKVQRLEHNLAVTEQIAELRGSLLRQLEEESAQEQRERSKKKTGGSAKSSDEPKA
jgi:transposase